MDTKCEVIGWLDIDADKAELLVREESGYISRQTANSEGSFAHQAIQTGTFRRGNAIVDPVTRQVLGYEMERVQGPLAALG